LLLMTYTQSEWLGSATITPDTPVVAGEYGTWRIDYVVGVSGIDDGGRLRLALRSVSDWAAPQLSDSAAADYVTIAASAPVRLTPTFGGDGIRPWNRTLTVRVSDGALAPDDVVTLVLGDTSGGGPGMRAQTFPERHFSFRLQADPFGTGLYQDVAFLGFPIVAGPAARLVAVAPSDAIVGEPAWLQVRALDRWGNPDAAYRGRVAFAGDVPAGLPASYTFTAEDAGVHRFEGLRFDAEGVRVVTVADAEAGWRATSNPLRCHAARPAQRIYWGDLHGQTGETVGTGSLADFFAYARDVAAVDATGHQGNDFQLTAAIYDDIQAHVARFHQPGRFVTFHGYEWSGNTPAGGDRNVYYLHGGPLHRSSHAQVPDTSDVESDRYPADRLFATFQGREDVLLVPHIGGRHANLAYHAPELEPVIELASQWGRFEWFARDALERGLRVGFIGGSDDHSGRPGWSAPTLAHHGVRGGLTAFLATDLTREALWEALRARRCYGTSGARIVVDVTVDGHPMGSECTASAPPRVRCRVIGTAPIDTVELRRGLETVATYRVRPAPAPGDPWRVRVAWRGARNRGRGRALDWSGEIVVDGGRITGVADYAIDSPLEGVTSWDAACVRWRSHTVGDWDGVVLDLDGDDRTVLRFTAPTTAFTVALGDLGRDGVRHTGPLLEQQVGIERLALQDGPREAALDWHDDTPVDGVNSYWVWVTQMDGELAWSSPVYVTWDSPARE
jgi:hypothetical protein